MMKIHLKKEHSFSEVGKLLKIARMGRNNIIALLKWKDILCENNLLNDEYNDAGFFTTEMIRTKNAGMVETCRVTPSGVSFIQEMINEWKEDFQQIENDALEEILKVRKRNWI